MTVTVVAQLVINDAAPEQLGKYFEITTSLLEKAGARIARRYTQVKPVVGSDESVIIVVVEYPDRQAVDDVFESREYQQAIPHRDLAFSKYHISIYETEEFATYNDPAPSNAE